MAEGGFLVHGRPASEYRTRKPTAAISDFTTNRAAAAPQLVQPSATVQLKDSAVRGKDFARCRQGLP